MEEEEESMEGDSYVVTTPDEMENANSYKCSIVIGRWSEPEPELSWESVRSGIDINYRLFNIQCAGIIINLRTNQCLSDPIV